MKVRDIIKKAEPQFVSEAEIINRLQKFNWRYEYSDNFREISRGSVELELLENAVFNLWKQDPIRAVYIWNEYSDQSPVDKTITPSFIFRKAVKEQNE